ncbi:hypothetical protein MUP59_08195 [Candidatus Bathyarchaeota archaeon]|nr:hypothetical protein [Candidatus Bathyarchaeota archaeon]
MSSYCCKALQEARRRWDRPFYYPLRITEDKDIVADRLCLEMWNTTKSGNMTKRGRGWAQVNYCPFCGKYLVEAKHDEHSPDSTEVA